MFLQLRTYFYFQLFSAILGTSTLECDSHLKPLQGVVLGIQSQEHVLHFHMHFHH